jgi:hypothetical protein
MAFDLKAMHQAAEDVLRQIRVGRGWDRPAVTTRQQVDPSMTDEQQAKAVERALSGQGECPQCGETVDGLFEVHYSGLPNDSILWRDGVVRICQHCTRGKYPSEFYPAGYNDWVETLAKPGYPDDPDWDYNFYNFVEF